MTDYVAAPDWWPLPPYRWYNLNGLSRAWLSIPGVGEQIWRRMVETSSAAANEFADSMERIQAALALSPEEAEAIAARIVELSETRKHHFTQGGS